MKGIIIISSLLLLACGVEKEVVKTEGEDHVQEEEEVLFEEDKTYNVSIKLFRFTPYCGGAAPDWEMEQRQTSPMNYTTLLLLDLDANMKREVKTDSAGVLYLNLKPGKYAIREKYKDCSFEEFKKQNFQNSDDYYISTPDSNCYYNWWSSNFLEFEVTKEDSLYQYSQTTYSQCFTGRNPCINYIGPWPP